MLDPPEMPNSLYFDIGIDELLSMRRVLTGCATRRGKTMSIEIDVLNGNTSWPAAEPLFRTVWSPEIMAAKPWRDVKWANADLRVLIETPDDGLACHVGI